MTDTLTTPVVLGLLKALDEGDKTALYPLADALMEVGDHRGMGVLWLIENEKWPENIDVNKDGIYPVNWWSKTHANKRGECHRLPVMISKLKVFGQYKSLSEAILDGADILVKEGICK